MGMFCSSGSLLKNVCCALTCRNTAVIDRLNTEEMSKFTAIYVPSVHVDPVMALVILNHLLVIHSPIVSLQYSHSHNGLSS